MCYGYGEFREQWKGYVAPYQPVFMDGWSPVIPDSNLGAAVASEAQRRAQELRVAREQEASVFNYFIPSFVSTLFHVSQQQQQQNVMFTFCYILAAGNLAACLFAVQKHTLKIDLSLSLSLFYLFQYINKSD